MCELLEVSRSGYYKWRESRDSAPTPARRRRAELDIKVAKFHAASDGVYGAPRILADLRADGEQVSRKTVAASLRRQGLAGICPRRFAPATTVVDLDAAVPKDLVRRRFDTGLLNRVWTSDITYLGTGQGWLYLCAVRDGCSRRVIGWALDEYLHTDLVQAAVAMAVAMRGELAEQVVLHADRGCQGGFNWSSQHGVVNSSVVGRQALRRCSPPECLAGPAVECIGNSLNVSALIASEVGALRKVLPQQSIGILVRPSLPRTVGIAEVDSDPGGFSQFGMTRQFLTSVPRHRPAQMIRQRCQRHRERVPNRFRSVPRQRWPVLDRRSRAVAVLARQM